MIKAGIIGASGYAGCELLRILLMHPEAEVTAISSHSYTGKKIYDLYPNFYQVCDLEFIEDTEVIEKADIIFASLPHGLSEKYAKTCVEKGKKFIDLGADFRLDKEEDYQKWYGLDYNLPELHKNQVYGLPEVNRDAIGKAQVIGNPGCYPTTAILGLKPLIDAQNSQQQALIEPWIIIDAKSGVSGAGRQAKMNLLFSETSDSFSAYGVAGHRHGPEITQGIDQILGQNKRFQPHDIRFVPHLVPMIRGMFTTIHVRLTAAGQALDLQSLYETSYQNEYFVDVMPKGMYPDTRSVRGSNYLRIAVQTLENSPMATILVVQDNLVKGAAGQAVQNMNVMFGLA